MLGSALKTRKVVVKKAAKPKEKKEKKDVPKFTEAEMAHLRLAFNLLDKNSDGHMSVSELQGMLENMGILLTWEFTDMLVKSASKSGNLCLDETEFMNWVYKIQMVREDVSKNKDKTEPITPEEEDEDLKNDLRAAFW